MHPLESPGMSYAGTRNHIGNAHYLAFNPFKNSLIIALPAFYPHSVMNQAVAIAVIQSDIVFEDVIWHHPTPNWLLLVSAHPVKPLNGPVNDDKWPIWNWHPP